MEITYNSCILGQPIIHHNMGRAGFTYMISNYERTVIYIGVTNNIYKRMFDYKNNLGGYFATKYNCKYLVYYENFLAIGDAIAREKQFKNWHKDWKWNLVKANNPELNDLSADWFTQDNQLKDPDLAKQHLRGF